MSIDGPAQTPNTQPRQQAPLIPAEELLELAHGYRAIGVYPRKWSYATTSENEGALLSTTNPRYLYRGQTKRYEPCFPALFRHLKTSARFLWEVPRGDATKIVAHIARTFWYYSELEKHPIFRWAKEKRLHLPLAELAQHYGIATPLLDLSESIEVALFFATHQFRDGAFTPCVSGTGVLYRVNRSTMPKEYSRRFTSVAIQPFLRPFRQWAWTCELLMGECLEACPGLERLEFEHSEMLANRIRAMAEADGPLFPPDELAEIAVVINASRTLPRSSEEAAAKHLEFAFPIEKCGAVEEALTAAGYLIADEVPPVLTTERAAELEPACASAVQAWNAETAPRLRQYYIRYSHDGTVVQYAEPSDTGEWQITTVPSDWFPRASNEVGNAENGVQKTQTAD